MHRLIIVDNEPVIVRGLQQLLEEESPVELDVYGAQSAAEALALMERMRIDIALLDIRMPGMNGLELQERIVAQWPQCRIVFLTGHNDFAYIQTAVRNGSVDYILKTDGDDAILQAIQKAAREISRETEKDRLLGEAKTKWNESLGSLQKGYLEQALNGLSAVRQDKLDELRLPLRAEEAPHVFIARVDRWNPAFGESDKALIHYAIQNIAAESMTGCLSACTAIDHLVVVFLQADPDGRWHGSPERLSRFVKGKLESVQSACREFLNVPLSIAACAEPVEWERLPAKYAELRRMLFYGFGLREEMLLTDEVALNFNEEGEGEEAVLRARSQLKQFLSAEWLMHARLLQDFEALAELSRHLTRQDRFLYEMYNGISYMLLSYLNENSKWDRFKMRDGSGKLFSLDAHTSWEQALAYLQELLVLLLQERNEESEAGADFLIAKLKAHIDKHLDEELSLIRLAEIVYLNPTYLSRLFKQCTGEGLSTYIAQLKLERARELLRYSKLKIQDVALKVGFDSATSFGRFFKRETNMTPQEYRDSEPESHA